MKVIIRSSKVSETFQAELSNISQFIDYMEHEKPELFQQIKQEKLKYVLVDSTETFSPLNLTEHIVETPFDNYDALVVAGDISGEGLFSAIAAAIAGAIAGTSAAVAAGTALAIAIDVGLSVALAVALGAITSLLTPNSSIKGDPSQSAKNSNLNGIPPIEEQGGPIPVVVGECFFAAIKVGQNVSTIDIAVDDGVTGLDSHISTIFPPEIKTKGNSSWYRVS